MDLPHQRCASDTRTVRVADTCALPGLLVAAAATGWSLVSVVRQPRDLLVELTR